MSKLIAEKEVAKQLWAIFMMMVNGKGKLVWWHLISSLDCLIGWLPNVKLEDQKIPIVLGSQCLFFFNNLFPCNFANTPVNN